MREVIQIGDTLKVTVFHYSYKELRNKNKRFVGQQWIYYDVFCAVLYVIEKRLLMANAPG